MELSLQWFYTAWAWSMKKKVEAIIAMEMIQSEMATIS